MELSTKSGKELSNSNNENYKHKEIISTIMNKSFLSHKQALICEIFI